LAVRSPWLCLNLLTRDHLQEVENVRDLLMRLAATAPLLKPEKVDMVEPMREKFGEAFFKKYANSYSWHMVLFKRSAPAMEGHAGPAAMKEHGHVTVCTEAAPDTIAALQKVYRNWTKSRKLVFAQLSVPSVPVKKRAEASNTYSTLRRRDPRPVISFGMVNLLKGIPDLYWLTTFGPDYVRHIGKKKLESAPVAKVEEAKGCITLQLTDDPQDMIDQPLLVESVRTRTVRHLGAEHFFDPARPKGARVPASVRKLMPDWFGKDDDELE
jgi:hypothetical protein